MGILSRIFRSRDAPKNATAGSGYSFMLGTATSGKAVNERSSMQITAVYSCVRILSEAIASLPLHLYKYTDTVYEDVRSLIIGKMYSPDDLAFYNKGKQFPQLAVSNINSAIESVLFPSMSMEQDNIERVRSMTSRAIKVTSYIILPMMFGMSVCAEPLIGLILTDKWLECVPYMRIFCFGLAIVPISLANLNAIKAIGRSDIYLKLEIIRKSINTVSLLGLMWFGVKAIAYSYLLNCVINLIINAAPNKKFLNYGYLAQIKDLIPATLLSGFMAVMTYSVVFLHLPYWATLLIQIPVGIGIYIAGSILFKVDSFQYIISVLMGLKNRKNKKKPDGVSK